MNQNNIKLTEEMLKNNINDHIILFSTFTFKDVHRIPKFHEFFSFFMSRLNSKLINARSKNAITQKAKLIVHSELSRISANKSVITPEHFHGFLFIPKCFEKYFNKKCVTDRCLKDDQYDVVTLDDKLLKYTHFKDDPDNMLVIDRSEFSIVEPSDLFAPAAYSSKYIPFKSLLGSEKTIIY